MRSWDLHLLGLWKDNLYEYNVYPFDSGSLLVTGRVSVSSRLSSYPGRVFYLTAQSQDLWSARFLGP